MMILLISTVLSIILIYLLKKNRNLVKSLVPPGPLGLPFIGNLLQFGTASNLHVYLWQLSKKYGPIMQMKIGSVPILVVCSEKLAKEVLKTQDLAFCSRPQFLGPRKIFYNYVDIGFSPYGDYWREVRKITSIHLLSQKKIQSFRPIREDEIYRMVAKISSFASSSHEAINLSEITMALGSTLICRIAFGKRYDEEGLEMQRFDKLLHEAQALLATFFVSDYFPALSWVDKLAGLINRLEKTFKKMDSFNQELINEHLDPNRAKKTEEEQDILDVLIQLLEQKSSSIDFNWDHIKALLADIFIAGTDTSAASTIWIMTALMKELHVMEKVQAEIRNFIGEKGKVDEDDLPKLSYLKAVINESFRLYPPAPLLMPRETVDRCTLEGYEIQPKTIVYVNAWAVARDPEYWENPDEFLPERFLNSDTDIKGQDFGGIPFGSLTNLSGNVYGTGKCGANSCKSLYSFDWELPPGIHAEDIDTDALPGLTMHKKNPLYLVPMKYAF